MRDHVIAFQPGFGLAHWTASRGSGPEHPVLLRLRQEAAVEGVVVADNGQPAEGALVMAGFSYHCPGCSLGFTRSVHEIGLSRTEPLPELVATADSQGHFRIAHLPRDRRGGSLLVWRGPSSVAKVKVALDEEVNRTKITLQSPGRIEGKVTSEATGKPGAGLKVVASPTDGEICPKVSTVTDADGAYVLGDLPPSGYSVRVILPDDAEWAVAETRHVSVRPNEVTGHVDFLMAETGVVRGVVVEAGTDQPVGPVTLSAWSQDAWPVQAESGADGAFRFRYPAGIHCLDFKLRNVPRGYVTDPAYMMYFFQSCARYRRAATIPLGGETQALKLEVTRGITLVGKAVDRRGRPLPGCRILPSRQHDDAVTDKDGVFRLFGVIPNTTFTLVVMNEREKLGRSVDVRIKSNPTQKVKVRLAPLATITGRTVDARGNPAAGIEVALAGFLGPYAGHVDKTSTDSDGRYEFIAPPGTKCHVYVSTGGTLLDETKVKAGRRYVMKDIVGEPARGRTTVSGRVLDGEGQPVPKARVEMRFVHDYSATLSMRPGKRRRVWLEGGTSSRDSVVTADERGEFRFPEDAVIGQPLTVRASAPEGTLVGRTSLTPEQPTTEVVVKLTKASGVVGRVIDERQQPLGGVRIRVFVEREKRFRSIAEMRTDDRGRYCITGLAPDTTGYVSAQAAGRWNGRSETITCQSGVVSEIVDLVLPKADSFISGTVTWRNVAPLGAVQVTCSRPGERYSPGVARPAAMTDSQGRYQLVGVPADMDLEVSAFPRRRGCPARLRRKATGGSTNVDFVVKRTPLWRRFLGLFRSQR